MKAGVLAVGTELTSGQITNRNAAWISQRLTQRGLQTEIHMTVADDRQAIREALELLERKADLIFVTGGLGPTSDDFTRELITEWAGQPLEFHEPSWTKIQERLKARNLPVREFQKQQCQFPKGSQVLENSQGTANAFWLTKGSKKLWALPGPPNEIAAVWNDHIQAQVADLTQNLNAYITYSWDALGLGEAVAPTLVEPIVQGSGADIGYRVHLPYLEIKISFYKSELDKMKPVLAKVEEALKQYTISRNGEDILQLLTPVLSRVPNLFVCDEVSQGLLLSRLQAIRKTGITYTTEKALAGRLDLKTHWQIHCHFKDEFDFELELLSPEKESLHKVITSPFSRTPNMNGGMVAMMSDRRRQYFAEIALITAVQHWRD